MSEENTESCDFAVARLNRRSDERAVCVNAVAASRRSFGLQRLRFALVGLAVGAWVGDAAFELPLPIGLVGACMGLIIAEVDEIRTMLRR